MPILAAVGVSFEGFGAGGRGSGAGSGDEAGGEGAGGGDEAGGGAGLEGWSGRADGGWAAARWEPTPLACNPHGIVQAGVHAVVLDAAMNFAVNASLDGDDRSRATLEMKTETMRAARAGQALAVGGRVTRLARQVAYTEAVVRDEGGQLVSRATGTFLLHREP